MITSNLNILFKVDFYNISDKEKYIDWLKNIIDIRVDAIVSGSFRGLYYKTAILVVALGEVFELNNIIDKSDFIDFYLKKYSF